jgi:hypothetical protein
MYKMEKVDNSKPDSLLLDCRNSVSVGKIITAVMKRGGRK